MCKRDGYQVVAMVVQRKAAEARADSEGVEWKVVDGTSLV